jgi:hypothetical protein
MIEVKFLKNFYANGQKHEKNQVIEVSEAQANELQKRGVVTTTIKPKAKVEPKEK